MLVLIIGLAVVLNKTGSEHYKLEKNAFKLVPEIAQISVTNINEKSE